MTRFSRRAFLAGGTSALALLGSGLRAEGGVFGPDYVREKARALAAEPYQPRPFVPEPWLNLTYDQYRDIRFHKNAALWAGTDRSYNIDFFAPGLYFPQATQMHAVEDGQTRLIPFDLDAFDKGPLVPTLPREGDLGYAGLRLRTDLGHPDGKTEYCVFQGASYFRAIGIGQTYGLSARGLALRTGDPEGEEFPSFIEFWLEAPKPGQLHMVVHAILDSPSVAGAFRFVVTPGEACVMDVQATLFPRETLDHVGLGALTSMFLFDATDHTRFDDFRPAVHDSDGLLVMNGAGEVLWRPLSNPVELQVSSFVDEAPRGFGLMQRSRSFSDFADLEALYHNRPSLWVAPEGDWGRGAVTLVEIPADKEIYDNIVAYWRPAAPYAPGQEVDLAYRLTWGPDAPVDPGLARVIETKMGLSFNRDRELAVIDFENHPIFEDGVDAMSIHVSSPHAETSDGILQRNPETGGLRLTFAFDPGDQPRVELRAQLLKDGKMATEVWLYRWTPA